jgi:hypothetical protein
MLTASNISDSPFSAFGGEQRDGQFLRELRKFGETLIHAVYIEQTDGVRVS